YLGDDGGASRNDARVPRVPGAALDDDAGADRVVVAAGEQGGPCRRAERRGVKTVVDQPGPGELIQVRRRHRSAEGATHAEADVVEQDQQDVWRALGGPDRLGIARRRVLVRLADLALELRIGPGELAAVGGLRGITLVLRQRQAVGRRQPAEQSP